MSIWKLYDSLRGGWKTHGPNAIDGPGAFDSSDDTPFNTVTADTSMKLSAVSACINLRSEVFGSLPVNLRDKEKKILHDHPLQRVIHTAPNYDMTAPEFWAFQCATVDMQGNSVNIIERGLKKKVVALTPVSMDAGIEVKYNKSGSRKKWKIGRDDFDDDDILHLRGFSLDPHWGLARIDIGRQILQAQLTANHSAMLAFKQGLKVGGFMLNDSTRDLTTPELTAFQERLNFFGRPENIGKWMNLPRNVKPLAGTEFSVKPVDSQLLESRYFGIEEICRLFNVPPQLIGHTNKASSWASSIENINLFFLMYSMQPTITRTEKRIEKKLLTGEEVASGMQVKFNTSALLRGDIKARNAAYVSGLQNGYLSQNDVLEMEDRPGIGPEGDVYRVQLNMANAEDDAADDKKPVPAEEDAK